MLPGKTYTPEDFAAMAWRRKWLILVPFLAVFLVTAVVASYLPDKYRSEAVMVVVPQRVPDSYVRSVVTQQGPPPRIEDRVQALRQQVTSRTGLEAIVREFDLYPDLRQRAPMEDVVERMRTDIAVEVVRGDAFRVTYTAADPRIAQRVAARLAAQFSEEALRERAGLADQTTLFLKSQLDEARLRLAEQERKLAAYKQTHAGELPTEREATLQVLSNTQLQAQNLEESINRDRDRRLFLERQIADYEAEAAKTPPRPAPPVSGADPSSAGGGSAAERLEVARAELTALELKLKPEHPDIIRKKREIRDLEAKAQAEEQQKGPSAATPAAPATPEEVARRNRIRDAREEIASIDIQLRTKENERQRLRDQVSSYERKLAAMPAREAELTSLTRDYETGRKTYESLLARQEDSKMSADLERRQIGEQFRMVDAPRVPERPVSPNRAQLDLLGAAVGLGLGFGLALLLEYRDTSVRSDSDVTRTLALPVLAAVPVIMTDSERRRLRRRRILIAVAACAFIVAGAVAAWRLGFLRGPL